MGFDGKKQHEAIHKAEISVKTWLQSGRHLPRLQQDNRTSSTLLSCNYVLLLKQLPSWQQLSARVKLNPHCICFSILKETTFLLVFKKWSCLRNPLVTESEG